MPRLLGELALQRRDAILARRACRPGIPRAGAMVPESADSRARRASRRSSRRARDRAPLTASAQPAVTLLVFLARAAGHGSLRPTFGCSRTYCVTGSALAAAPCEAALGIAPPRPDGRRGGGATSDGASACWNRSCAVRRVGLHRWTSSGLRIWIFDRIVTRRASRDRASR